MNLTDKKVVHSVFGTGRIISLESGKIMIEFSEEIGQKLFLYPNAFEHFLKMSNASAQTSVERDLNEFLSNLEIKKIAEALKAKEDARILKEKEDALFEKNSATEVPIKKISAKKAPVKKIPAKKVTKKTITSDIIL